MKIETIKDGDKFVKGDVKIYKNCFFQLFLAGDVSLVCSFSSRSAFFDHMTTDAISRIGDDRLYYRWVEDED